MGIKSKLERRTAIENLFLLYMYLRTSMVSYAGLDGCGGWKDQQAIENDIGLKTDAASKYIKLMNEAGLLFYTRGVYGMASVFTTVDSPELVKAVQQKLRGKLQSKQLGWTKNKVIN